MVKNLKRAKKLLEKEGRASDYDFFPQTYVLPLEHGIFVEEFRRNPGEFCAVDFECMIPPGHAVQKPPIATVPKSSVCADI